MRATRRTFLFLLSLSVFAGGSFEAGADEMSAYRSLNLGLAERHVIPRYEDLAASTNQLDRRARFFCAQPSAEGLSELQADFGRALDAWMGVQHLRFGPVEFLLRYDRFTFWPDKRNTGGRHLAALLAKADPTALEPQAFARGSVAVQGFSALERLLYQDGAATAFDDPFRCQVVLAITGNLREMSQGTLLGWTDGEKAFGEVMAGAGPDNAFYADDKEATLEFFKAFHGSLQMIGDLKLARPLGASIEKARGRRTESWRSGRSLDNIRANLAALDELYAGEAGFTVLVLPVEGGPALDKALRGRLDRARALAQDIDSPLSEAIADPAQRERVEKLLAEVEAIRELATTRLAAALDLPVGFNAFDGD